jgi:hypothetical protein
MDLINRLQKIETLEDVDVQLALAKQYYIKMRAKVKDKKLTFDEKVLVAKKLKAAEQTLLKFRKIIFDVEDAIIANKLATSVIT